MTTEEALKIDPARYSVHGDVATALRVLADALREAQAQTVQMREVVRQDHCDYGDACVLHKMKEVVSTLPAPAARTYDDAIRDAAKAIRDQAIRTFGKPTTVANGYAEVVESLLSPAPAVAPVDPAFVRAMKGESLVAAVAPVAQKHDPDKGCAGCENHRTNPHRCGPLGAVLLSHRLTEGAPDWCPKRAPVAAPKPGPTVCADCGAPAVHLDVKNLRHATPCCGSQPCCFFGCMGYATRPLDAPDGKPGATASTVAAPKPRVIVAPPIDFSEEDAPDEKPVAFDAEAALVAMEQSIARRQHGPTPATRYEVYTAIQDALAAGRGAR